MGFIKHGSPVDIQTVSIPKDLHWKVLRALCLALGRDLATLPILLGAIRSRNVPLLLECSRLLSPRSMLSTDDIAASSPWEFYRRYQLGALLKKFPFKGFDTKSPAMLKFLQGEKKCELFNKENFQALVRLNESSYRHAGIIEDIQREIKEVLGERPPSDFSGFAQHGPGAAMGEYKDGAVTTYFKYAELPYSITHRALPYAKDLIASDPRWLGALDDWFRSKTANRFGPIDLEDFWAAVFQCIDPNRVTTVPKTAEIDRTIAVESVIGVMLQLGVDRYIRKRLKHTWGFDLNSQVLNQELAHEGSLTDEIATIDLANASETVSLKICELYLPAEWYYLLLDLRSEYAYVGQKVPNDELPDRCYLHRYEKLSSMGNGFTFVIETLIFGAIARVVCKRRKADLSKVVVYGDDIVVPSSIYSDVVDMLHLSGFEVGEDKSFANGPFRESCGKDYLRGWNVRPVMLKGYLRSVADLFYLHNAFFVLQRDESHALHGADIEEVLTLIRSFIPVSMKQFVGPVGENWDTHLFVEAHEKCFRDKYGRRCFYAIHPRAATFNKKTSFLFRKLMVNLKPRDKWDESKPWREKHKVSAGGGSAFDVTKRDAVRYYCTRHVWDYQTYENLNKPFTCLKKP